MAAVAPQMSARTGVVMQNDALPQTTPPAMIPLRISLTLRPFSTPYLKEKQLMLVTTALPIARIIQMGPVQRLKREIALELSPSQARMGNSVKINSPPKRELRTVSKSPFSLPQKFTAEILRSRMVRKTATASPMKLPKVKTEELPKKSCPMAMTISRLSSNPTVPKTIRKRHSKDPALPITLEKATMSASAQRMEPVMVLPLLSSPCILPRQRLQVSVLKESGKRGFSNILHLIQKVLTSGQSQMQKAVMRRLKPRLVQRRRWRQEKQRPKPTMASRATKMVVRTDPMLMKEFATTMQLPQRAEMMTWRQRTSMPKMRLLGLLRGGVGLVSWSSTSFVSSCIVYIIFEKASIMGEGDYQWLGNIWILCVDEI